MNIEDYISSGILEAYVVGDVTPAERAEVERLLQQHPALREELKRIEETLEVLALKAAVSPRPEIKNKIFQALVHEAKVVPFISPSWRWAAAASIAVAIIASYLAFSYRSQWIESKTALDNLIAQNQSIAQNYNTVNEKLDKIQGDFAIIENTAYRKVVLKGTRNDLTAQASVYWNETTSEAYISIQNLKELSQDSQYQLWAIVKGKPVDVGVFDKNFSGLLKMKNIVGAAAFAVTVEPRGGNQAPTLETMQVIGAVDRRAG